MMTITITYLELVKDLIILAVYNCINYTLLLALYNKSVYNCCLSELRIWRVKIRIIANRVDWFRPMSKN